MTLFGKMSKENVSIFFVQDTTSNCKDMRLAFSTCQGAHLKPQIISEDQVEGLPHNRTTVYVLEQFKGEIFQFLSSKECLVVGPRCLYNCLKKKIPIPENDSPVFTLAMMGVIATASKLSRVQKEELATLIGYMGGVYTDVFTLAVSHLITDEGRSPKHQKAIDLQIPIMSSSWVKAVWDESQSRDIAATDSDFLKHRLPPFKGMHISCTNISQETKRKLQSIIEANGGIYMASLEQNKTLILIVGEPEGKKFQHAQLWGIPCLKPSWIYDSAEKGAALKSTDYAVNGRPKCSTPTSELPSFMSTDISFVPRDTEYSTSKINDTNMSVASTCSLPQVKPKPSHNYDEVLHKIETLQIRNGSLLDGCKIFFSGFNPDDIEKLKKIVNKSGGIFSMQITERLTHVVVGSVVESDNLAVSKLSNNPHSVTLNWLLDSLKNDNVASVETYLVGTKDARQPNSSPLSSKGVHLLKSPEELSSHPVAKQRLFEDSPKVPLQEIVTPQNMPSKSKESETANVEPPLENEETAEMNASCIEPIFQGLTFIISGFGHADPGIELVKSLGGKVYSKNYKKTVDYIVVPLLDNSSLKGRQIVTNLWIDDCYENGKLLPVEYYHKPVLVSEDKKPLTGNIICISGYSGKERGFLACIASALGAVVQEKLSRKDHPEEGILAATHLLCQTRSGSKYNASVKWGIPVVDKDWLFEKLNGPENSEVPRDELPAENEKDVKMTPVNPSLKRVALTTPSIVESTATFSSSKYNNLIETPLKTTDVPEKITSDEPDKRKLATPSPKAMDENFLTPISRKLSLSLCGKSPFHVDTPESPYGQVFMNEGEAPSPAMRKRWKNWIDNLPDLYEGSPELQSFRKRRPSTPLTVVMKQLWVKFGGAQIDGIDSETGDLLPDGPYKEWAHENESIKVPSDTPNSLEKKEESCLATNGWLKKDHKPKKSEEVAAKKASIETEEPTTAAPDLTTESQHSKSSSSNSPKCSKYWGSSKSDRKKVDDEEFTSWDFGKPFALEKRNEVEPEKKKRKLISETPSDSSRFESSKKSGGFVPETEEISPEDEIPKGISQRRLFVMTNISVPMREKFEGIVKNLGGEVSQLPHFDPLSTHLIIDKPVRSEKLLCSIASGKWVLHLSYLSQCYQSRTFLPEEDFEWGNERSQERLPHLDGSIESELAKAAHRWRIKTCRASKPCAFENFKVVIVCTSQNKYAQYQRILEAGGALILAQTSIFEATHVFWDESSTLPVPKKSILNRNIHLLKPVYLGEYLTKTPPPDPKRYSIA